MFFWMTKVTLEDWNLQLVKVYLVRPNLGRGGLSFATIKFAALSRRPAACQKCVRRSVKSGVRPCPVHAAKRQARVVNNVRKCSHLNNSDELEGKVFELHPLSILFHCLGYNKKRVYRTPVKCPKQEEKGDRSQPILKHTRTAQI
jgi:hypothetical protein